VELQLEPEFIRDAVVEGLNAAYGSELPRPLTRSDIGAENFSNVGLYLDLAWEDEEAITWTDGFGRIHTTMQLSRFTDNNRWFIITKHPLNGTFVTIDSRTLEMQP
jgi:hypothetical protein